jgi:hypothetical protein
MAKNKLWIILAVIALIVVGMLIQKNYGTFSIVPTSNSMCLKSNVVDPTNAISWMQATWLAVDYNHAGHLSAFTRQQPSGGDNVNCATHYAGYTQLTGNGLTHLFVNGTTIGVGVDGGVYCNFVTYRLDSTNSVGADLTDCNSTVCPYSPGYSTTCEKFVSVIGSACGTTFIMSEINFLNTNYPAEAARYNSTTHSCGSSQVCIDGDQNCDGRISTVELINYAIMWIRGDINTNQLMIAADLWKHT